MMLAETKWEPGLLLPPGGSKARLPLPTGVMSMEAYQTAGLLALSSDNEATRSLLSQWWSHGAQ